MNIPNILSLIRLARSRIRSCFCRLPKAHVTRVLFLSSHPLPMLLTVYRKEIRHGHKARPGAGPSCRQADDGSALVCITIADPSRLDLYCFCDKEMLMGIGALVMYKRIDDVLPSNYLGKAASVVFFVFCLVLMLFNIPRPYSTAMLSAALVFAILAFIRYAIRFYDTTVKRQVGSEGEEESRSEV